MTTNKGEGQKTGLERFGYIKKGEVYELLR